MLAERLGTTRNALYKTLHDARNRLRAHLVSTGHLVPHHYYSRCAMTASRHVLTTAAVQGLLVDTNPWLSCDDCFRLVDQYVELLLHDPDAEMPAMNAHLAGCAACAEEAVTPCWSWPRRTPGSTRRLPWHTCPGPERAG